MLPYTNCRTVSVLCKALDDLGHFVTIRIITVINANGFCICFQPFVVLLMCCYVCLVKAQVSRVLVLLLSSSSSLSLLALFLSHSKIYYHLSSFPQIFKHLRITPFLDELKNDIPKIKRLLLLNPFDYRNNLVSSERITPYITETKLQKFKHRESFFFFFSLKIF